VSHVSDNEAFIQRAVELCTEINALSAWMHRQQQPQERLVVSFDVYCILLEYTVYIQQTGGTAVHSIEDFVRFDDLVYEADGRPLDVRINFFLPPRSFKID
jgi:hypothetical protein